jgi:hypothetical protein
MFFVLICVCFLVLYNYVSIVRSIEPTGILGLEIKIIIIIIIIKEDMGISCSHQIAKTVKMPKYADFYRGHLNCFMHQRG